MPERYIDPENNHDERLTVSCKVEGRKTVIFDEFETLDVYVSGTPIDLRDYSKTLFVISADIAAGDALYSIYGSMDGISQNKSLKMDESLVAGAEVEHSLTEDAWPYLLVEVKSKLFGVPAIISAVAHRK